MENNGEDKKVDLNKLLTTEVIKKSNNIDKITDKIYLGDEDGAKEFDFLKNEQIHNVLSLVGNPPTYPEDMKINLMNLNLEDCLNTNIINPIKECADFIDRSDKIYIHCSCGVNRSPAIAIGYLMWKTHASYDEVFNFVKQRRSCIEPNNLFVMQLKKLNNLLKNNNYDLQKIVIKSKKK